MPDRDIQAEVEEFLTRGFERKMKGSGVTDEDVAQEMWKDFVNSFGDTLQGKCTQWFKTPADVNTAIDFYSGDNPVPDAFVRKYNMLLGTVLDEAKVQFARNHGWMQ